jgi:hypothetical protein
MFKQIKFFLALLALSLCTEIFANCGEGRGIVEGEILYLLPSIEDTYFVIRSNNPAISAAATPNGQKKNNDFGFHPAFRVGVGYQCCPCGEGIKVDYTRLTARTTRSVSGNLLWATIGQPDGLGDFFAAYPGRAQSKLSLVYSRVDGLFIQPICTSSCKIGFSLHGGLEYAYLQLREHYVYTNFSTTTPLVGKVDLKSHAWGIGPQLGFKLNYCLYRGSFCCPGSLTLAIKASSSLLASKTQQSLLGRFQTTSLLNHTDQPTWRLAPVLHARAGLNYATCLSGTDVSLEVGYEFSSYFRFFTRSLSLSTAAPALTLNNYYSFDIQGLYVALNLTF